MQTEWRKLLLAGLEGFNGGPSFNLALASADGEAALLLLTQRLFTLHLLHVPRSVRRGLLW
jgi:hypothetical protein